MDVTLILALVKIGLEIFQDERRDKYLKKYTKLKKEYQDELNKGIDNRSDLAIDRMRIEAEQLAQLLISEANKS